MDIYRILIILCIIIITTGIMYNLYQQRKEILGIRDGFTNIEGLTADSSYVDKEFQSLKTQITWPSNISTSISPKMIGYPLKQYCIKGARNAACTGKYMNTEMITFCMQRGCRFLDFEIYSDLSNNAVVSNSTELTSKLPIALVFETIMGGAFNGYISPNYAEPMFIQLHIKMDPGNPTIQSFIKTIANVIKVKITSTGLQYNGKISFNTKLNEMMGKVVVLVNQHAMPDPNNQYSQILSSNSDLGTVVNMMVGGYDVCPVITFTSMKKLDTDANALKPQLKSDSITTNIDRLREVILDPTVQMNLDCYPVISNYGIQLLPYTFYYMSDYGTELQKYEGIFSVTKSGFIPLGYVLNYITANTPMIGMSGLGMG